MADSNTSNNNRATVTPKIQKTEQPKQPKEGTNSQEYNPGSQNQNNMAINEAILSITAGPEIQLRKLGSKRVAELMSTITKQKVDEKSIWFNFKANRATFLLVTKNQNWAKLEEQCNNSQDRDGTTFRTTIKPKMHFAVVHNVEPEANLSFLTDKAEKETDAKILQTQRLGKSKTIKIGFNGEPNRSKFTFNGKCYKINQFDHKHKTKQSHSTSNNKNGETLNINGKSYAQALCQKGPNDNISSNDKTGPNNETENKPNEAKNNSEKGLSAIEVRDIVKEMFEILVAPLMSKLIEEIGALKRELGKPLSPDSPLHEGGENPIVSVTPHTSPLPQSEEPTASETSAHPSHPTTKASNETPLPTVSHSTTSTVHSSNEKNSSHPSPSPSDTQSSQKRKKSRIPSPTQPSSSPIRLRSRGKRRNNNN